MKRSILLTALLCLLGTNATAQGYFGAGVMYTSFDEPGFSVVNPIASNFIVGAYINENLALEGRYGFNIVDGSGDGYQLSVERHLGFYVRPTFTNATASVYGLFGLTEGLVKADYTGGGTLTIADFGMTGGAGVLFPVQDDFGVQAEWISILNRPTYSFSAFSVALVRSF